MVLGSVGILFNDGLSSIPFLHDFSSAIFSYLEDFNLFSHSKVEEVITELPVEDHNGTGYTISTIAVFIAGVAITFCVLLAVDYYDPELMSKIPMVNNAMENVHSIWEAVTNYFNSSSLVSPENMSTISDTESCGSASSQDSDITIRDLRTSKTSIVYYPNPNLDETLYK